MMYGELVKELRDSAEWADRLALLMGRSEGDAHAPVMRKAADAIEELSRKYIEECNAAVELTGELASKPRWIPVDEYGVLPDHYETVLLYIESEPEGYITIGSYDYIEMRWKDLCDVNREVYQADAVTHWMPLPQPPKEE